MKQIQWYENKMHPAEYSTRLLLDIRLRLVDTPVIGYWAKEVTLQLKSTFRRNTNSKIVSFSFILSIRSMDGWGGYPPPHHSLLFKHWTLGPTSPLLANTQIHTKEIHKYTLRKYTLSQNFIWFIVKIQLDQVSYDTITKYFAMCCDKMLKIKMFYEIAPRRDPLIWELAQKYGGHKSQLRCYQAGFTTN